jgi:hypothetical protein
VPEEMLKTIQRLGLERCFADFYAVSARQMGRASNSLAGTA